MINKIVKNYMDWIKKEKKDPFKEVEFLNKVNDYCLKNSIKAINIGDANKKKYRNLKKIYNKINKVEDFSYSADFIIDENYSVYLKEESYYDNELYIYEMKHPYTWDK